MSKAQAFADSIDDQTFDDPATDAVGTTDGADYGGADAQSQVAQANQESQAPPQQVDPAAEPLSPALAAQAQAAGQQTQGWIKDLLVNQYGMQGFAEAEDDQAAFGQVLQHWAMAQQQNQELAQQQAFLQQQLQQLRVAQQQGAVQAQQIAPQTQAQAQASKWKGPPEWNPAWASQLERAPDGRIVAKPGAMLDLPQKYEAYQQWLHQNESKLWENPADFVWQNGLSDRVEQMVRDQAQRIASEQITMLQANQFGQQIRAEDGHWMFQKDQFGRPATNPVTGTPVLTPEGQQYQASMTSLVQMGVPVPAARDIAKKLITGEGSLAFAALQQAGFDPTSAAAAAAPAQAATPQQRQAASNQAFLARASQQASRRPNHNGPATNGIPAAPPLPADRIDGFRAQLAAALAAAGPMDFTV